MKRHNRNQPGRGKPVLSAAPSPLEATARQLTIAGLALATVIGILLRTRTFQGAAQSWNACEYVWRAGTQKPSKSAFHSSALIQT